MAKRGRKPKSTAFKVLSGSRKDRVGLPAGVWNSADLRKPDWLDEQGGFAFERIVRALDKTGILSDTDLDAITLYCVTYSRWRNACVEVNRDGTSLVSDLGGIKSNPALAVISQCERQMSSLLDSFGLTPSSRSRVRAVSGPPKDALDEFLRQKA